LHLLAKASSERGSFSDSSEPFFIRHRKCVAATIAREALLENKEECENEKEK
jgi:hypothetical protein